jgi:hypothetical protein
MGKLRIMDCGFGRLSELGGRERNCGVFCGIVMLGECLWETVQIFGGWCVRCFYPSLIPE